MRKPANYRTLLNFDTNAKTVKGIKYGYRTGILYLAPANESGVINLCPFATDGCKADCLNTAGRGAFDSVQRARLEKTMFYVNHRDAFLESLRYDIRRLIAQAKRMGLTPVVRINGTSDVPKLAMQMAREFPDVQFYDYTKIPRPWQRTMSNYHLTFSHSELNESDCLDALQHGINVAVVFATKRGEQLPETWRGYRVIDGDVSDLRFTDDKGVVVGLRAKGRARKDTQSGFVVQILPAMSAAAGAR